MNNIDAKFACAKNDCTAATTGTCILGKLSPQECEHYLQITVEPSATEKIQQVNTPGRTFHAGSELGVFDTLRISSGSYSHVIALMGPFNAGKTCFLLSLYLLTSRQLCSHKYYMDTMKFQ